MKRIVIIGSQASGKSHLAARLGEILKLPVAHLDELFWSWRDENLTNDERNERVIALTQQEKWIIDGNFLKTLDARIAACDTVILLDLPKWLCEWRLLKRRAKVLFIPRQKLAPFQRNTWPMMKAIWAFPQKMKPRLESILQQHHAEIIILRSASDVENFMPQPK